MSTALRNLALAHLNRHPDRSARTLERHPPAAVAKVLLQAPPASSAAVLERLDPRWAGTCLEGFPDETRRLVLSELQVAAAAAVVRLLPQAVREDWVAGLPDSKRQVIHRALLHPPHSAGALVDTSVPTLFDDWTVGQATDHLCQQSESVPRDLVVVDRSRRVVGSVESGRLLCAHRERTVRSLPLRALRTVPEAAPVSALVGERWREAASIAVVDPSGTFAGILTADTLQPAAQRRSPPPAASLAAAIGELYWLGLCKILEGFSVAPAAARRKRNGIHGKRQL